MTQPTNISNLDKVYKSLIVLALIIALLVIASDIIIPFAFACLFSVVLLPIEKRLEDTVGRILSITIVLVASLSIMTLVVWLVVNQLATLAQSLPNLEQRFVALLSRLNEQVSNTFGISSAEQIQLLKEALKNLSTYVGSALLSASFLIYFFIQVPIYIFLLLLYREKFNQFFLSFTDGTELKWKDEVTGVVRGYISGLTIVVLISGTLNSIGLLIIGIDNAFFFGFLIGALTMIPYVGIIIGAMFPAVFALLTKDSLWYPIGVLALHFSVQFLEANFITPKVTGSRISVNALAAIVALLIGEKMLGIAGMILAVPAVGVARILLSYSGYWKPFVILLEDKPSLDIQQTSEKSNEAGKKKRKKK